RCCCRQGNRNVAAVGKPGIAAMKIRIKWRQNALVAALVEVPMIYILAVFVPPLGLLLNGQPFSALLNVAIIVPCVLFGLLFPVLFIVPSVHAVIAISMKREDRKHRELFDAIERH